MAKKYTKEVIINELWVDVVNGLTRYELMQKLDADKYSLPTSLLTKACKYNYINAAYDKCKIEMQGEAIGMRATILNRYLSVYNDAVMNSDRQSAIRALDSVTKLLGLNEADKLDITSNNKLEVNINFGTNNSKNNEDEEDVNQ